MNFELSNLKIPADFKGKETSKTKSNLLSPSVFTEKDVIPCIDKKKIIKPSDLVLGPVKTRIILESENTKENYKDKCIDLENRLKLFEQNEVKMKVTLHGYKDDIAKLESESKTRESNNTLEMSVLYDRYLKLEEKLNNDKDLLKKQLEDSEKNNLRLKLENRSLSMSIDETQCKLCSLEENYQSKVMECSEHMSDLMKHREVFGKLEILSKENEKLKTEKIELIKQLDATKLQFSNLLDEFNELKDSHDNKSRIIQQKSLDLLSEIDKNLICEKSLKEEVEKSKEFNEDLIKMESKCKELLAIKCNFESDILKLNAKIESQDEDLDIKSDHIFQLQKTSDTLQLTNTQLKIRLDAVLELISLQEKKLSSYQINPTESLVTMWREKVYQLLVNNKLNDIS